MASGLLGVRVYAEDTADENSAEESTPEVVIDAEADRCLQEMCAALAEAKEVDIMPLVPEDFDDVGQPGVQ
ncbi:MAG: hypothetical protein ACYTFZ_05765 [Planctomycetota bacterium]